MNTMLLHDFAYVPVNYQQVCELLLHQPGSWLSGIAKGAATEGEEMRLKIGPHNSLPLLGKTVRVQVGESVTRNDLTVIRLTWVATMTPGLFPVLSADLEVAALAPDLTQLTLQGRYQPPLGAFGERINRLLMHRVAEASVRAFLRRLSEGLVSKSQKNNPDSSTLD